MPTFFAVLYVAIFAAGVSGEVARFDAPMPQRCATFEQRYDPANRAFCDKWRVEHRVQRHG